MLCQYAKSIAKGSDFSQADIKNITIPFFGLRVPEVGSYSMARVCGDVCYFLVLPSIGRLAFPAGQTLKMPGLANCSLTTLAAFPIVFDVFVSGARRGLVFFVNSWFFEGLFCRWGSSKGLGAGTVGSGEYR
jgi:hypothetical protein